MIWQEYTALSHYNLGWWSHGIVNPSTHIRPTCNPCLLGESPPLSTDHLTTSSTKRNGNPTMDFILIDTPGQKGPTAHSAHNNKTFPNQNTEHKLCVHTDICCKVDSNISHVLGKRTTTRCSWTPEDWPQERHQIWEASYCIVIEGLNSKTMWMWNHWQSGGSQKKHEPWKGGR